MDTRASLADWSLVRAFLAVAETGSLSAAARALRQSQPTLGRQVRALEDALGTQLFERHARGLRPSPEGEALLPHAQSMREAMQALHLTAAGQSQRLEGTVRIATSIFMAHFLMPAILADIRRAEPLIQLELAASDTSENLLFREADIAVRMYRPTHGGLVTRHVADLDLGIFAARSYLERRGRPIRAEDLRDHDLIGYDRSDLIVQAMNAHGFPVTREDFKLRCDNQSAYWQLVRAGCGVGFSQRGVALADPLVEELDLGIELSPLPVWLTAPEAMRQTPRIRRIWDLLADALVGLR
ncbi:LysR family transcriptional regulator [Chachezhania antarctica]|uniref:LysR family transcriptional regulator n=1 Tax=Chachezhania antarctica TaxID=2340860 RepID=UPI000EB134F4|nr:LysR family transcriptional regulator [Chachezhania antarctica]|tara:strand:+ start:1825 stop:2718 length:894 start_codon:yes stop_codon:yes gene_type:complete